MKILKNGATLNLGMSKKKSYQNLKFSAEIHMPILESLDLKGASKLTTNLSHEADLVVKISGTSKISAKFSLFNFMVNASGASAIEINGKVRDNAKMEINGAYMIKAKKLVIDQNLELKASKASTTEINVNGKLRTYLSGASRCDMAETLKILVSMQLANQAQERCECAIKAQYINIGFINFINLTY